MLPFKNATICNISAEPIIHIRVNATALTQSSQFEIKAGAAAAATATE